jgi:hypothetical protein
MMESIVIDIAAPPARVWEVMFDVVRWPEWTASISRVQPLTPGPLQVGSRVRIHQPKLPPANWRVTELEPGIHFTWVSVAPGVRVTARHSVESTPTGSRVTLALHYHGLLGNLLAQMTRGITRRYLALEANGLKACCENTKG